VPQEPNNFVGRERELTELCELLGVTRALTLCGPGGIGKTRLAQRLLFHRGGAFPDGVCFVDLGDLWQPDLVISRVASALGSAKSPAGRCSTRSPMRWARAGCCWSWTTAST